MARILIVEDDPITMKVVSTVLQKSGHQTVSAEDGADAIYCLKNDNAFDLIITDIRMPYLDGRMLVKAVRMTHSLRHIPILLMSGVVGPKCISGLCQDGVTAFLAKPIKAEELLEYVDRCLLNTSVTLGE